MLKCVDMHHHRQYHTHIDKQGDNYDRCNRMYSVVWVGYSNRVALHVLLIGDNFPFLGMNGIGWKKTVALLCAKFIFIVPPITPQHLFLIVKTLFK